MPSVKLAASSPSQLTPTPNICTMAPAPKRSRPGPQSRPAPKKAKVLDVNLKLPRQFSIFPLSLRTSLTENWEADLLVELFDPLSDVEPYKKPHYSIRALDVNNEVATVHGCAFASLQKANFELMRMFLGRGERTWKAARRAAEHANPEFVRAQNVMALRVPESEARVMGWGFDTVGCLAFWETEEVNGRAVLKGSFVQRMWVLPAEVKVEVEAEAEVKVKMERD